jgi:hypothetical protein
MQRLWADLTKATPSNLSIIGPRSVGKTVIMNALAQRAAREDSPFEFVVYWHLGHVAPGSDDDFVAQLCDRLRAELATSGGDYSEHREYLGNHSFEFLKEVTESLNSEGKAILMLWDGFDKPLGQGKLSGHLWDQMRTIFYGKKHKIITATRARLSELIRSQDAITSPFWNIFDMNPVRVACFDKTDREAILAELSGRSFEASAKSELQNWTSGYPPLFLAVLNQIEVIQPAGSVDHQIVNAAAEGAVESIAGVLNDLWSDCSEPAKDLYRYLVEHGEMLAATLGKSEQIQLTEKGFITQAGNKTNRACRLLECFIQKQGNAGGSLVPLFGFWDQYRGNIRGLLELRLNQLTHIDERLRRLISRSIEDVPNFPHECLTSMRGIAERALDLVWEIEFSPGKTIPAEYVEYWRRTLPTWHNEKPLHAHLLAYQTVPPSRGLQCGLLQLLVGAAERIESRAKRVSKSTYVLLNTVHNFGNLGQHFAGEEMHEGAAVAATMSCLELAACLDRELAS